MFTNLIGAWLVLLLSFRSISPPFYEVIDFAHRVNMFCIPIFFLLLLILQIYYERPIRIFLDTLFSEKRNEQLETQARQRLLNAPFFIIGLNFSIWIGGAIIYWGIYKRYCTIELAANRVFFQMVLVGLISITVAFFVIEQLLQKKLVPYFFPSGGLYMTPKTTRIRISTRLAAFLFAVNLIPFISLLILVQGTYGTSLSSSRLLEHVRSSVVTNSLIAISIGIFLTVLMSLNFSRPIEAIIQTLKRIREGYLDRKVEVTTNDEIGYTGDVINEMTEGLKERERMKHSLELAKEVQLNLLPEKAPEIDGLDMAGISLYCDETGGDYYDYFRLSKDGEQKLGVTIGDVSDHGVPSALLMTTARAFIRFRASLPGNVADIVSDVNHHLTMDIEGGGQFMTLFFISIDIQNKTMNWIRAGHDPAVIYDPSLGEIEELKGKGIPLGIDENYQFQMNQKTGLTEGQLIVLSTDGIWEARNKKGEIFGKDRFYNLIRKNADLNATAITNMVVEEIEEFQDGFRREDDITMVVIKVEKNL
jgi:sigma-B regulation protein RsbU (phosphoserine phosphatase)